MIPEGGRGLRPPSACSLPGKYHSYSIYSRRQESAAARYTCSLRVSVKSGLLTRVCVECVCEVQAEVMARHPQSPVP